MTSWIFVASQVAFEQFSVKKLVLSTVLLSLVSRTIFVLPMGKGKVYYFGAVGTVPNVHTSRIQNGFRKHEFFVHFPKTPQTIAGRSALWIHGIHVIIPLQISVHRSAVLNEIYVVFFTFREVVGSA
jgi:hypothetical protein